MQEKDTQKEIEETIEASDNAINESVESAQSQCQIAEATLEQELKEYKDKYFRALAESENTRKRLQKEKIESQSFAIQSAIMEFLQPIDHFEHALKASKDHASSEVQNWLIGFEMILGQLKQVLESNDVCSFETVGKQFDPHMHEAIETEERSDVAEGTVLQEFLRGYKMGSRVIRPARVKVSISAKTEEMNQEEIEES